MTLSTPLWQQNEDYTAAEDRGVFAALAPNVGTAGASHLAVSQRGAGANMSVDVSAGAAVIAASVSSRGRYAVVSDAVENRAIAAAPGAGSSRIDLVVAAVADTEYGDASDEWTIDIITGTPGSSPVAPSPPAGALVLAQVQVDASVAAITDAAITDTRSFATSTVYASAAPAAAHDGQVWVAPGGGVAARAGGVWAPQPLRTAFRVESADGTGVSVSTGGVNAASINLGNPGVAVGVKADWSGSVVGSGGSRCQSRVFISLDGGSTWTGGQSTITSGVHATDQMPLGGTLAHKGTPSGDVLVRAELVRIGGSTQTADGTLSAVMVPIP